MKPSRPFCLFVLSVVSVFLLFTTVPAMAQTGAVTAESVPSDSNPLSGVQITVDIDIDMSDVDPPDEKLGSFTASLVWDPGVLCYVGNSGLQVGFTGVINDADADTGRIVFNGANPTGVGGAFTVITFTFDVCGLDSSGTDLDLEFSAMAAALTFQNLLTILTIHDGHIHIAPSGEDIVTAFSIPSDSEPKYCDTIEVDIRIDMSGMDPPDDKLGSFTATLDWDPEVLCYLGNSGLLAGFTGVINEEGVAAGHIVFNGANPDGVEGAVTVFRLYFHACGRESTSTDLDLEFSAMAAAITFRDLLPFLTTTDGHVHISYSPSEGITAVSIPSDSEPTQCDTFEVNIIIDISGMDPPDDKLGSFTATLDWDPEVLCYVGNSGALAGFTGMVNESNTASGRIIFNGANADGVGGVVTVFRIYFHACCRGGSNTDLDLEFSAMAAAITFRDLLPLLTVTDGHVHVMKDGDIDGNCLNSPGDALCVFWRAILADWQEECDFPWAELVADINDDGSITPGDALCIFWKAITGEWPDDCLPEPFGKSLLGETIYDVRIGSVSGKPLDVVHVPIIIDSPQGFDAFGLQLIYPADLLTFQGVLAAKATEDWVALDGVEIESGVVNIGGFHIEGLFEKGDIPILEAVFAVEEGVHGAGYFDLIHLMDHLAGACVEKGHVAVTTTPSDFGLSQNYPNPFNPVTTIDYTLAADSRVVLSVYNLLGQVVAVLEEGQQKAGHHQVQWDGSDMTSGVYFYRLIAGGTSRDDRSDFIDTKRMVLMK